MAVGALRCGQCGAQNPQGSGFCFSCGRPFHPQPPRPPGGAYPPSGVPSPHLLPCPHCQHPVSNQAASCPRCGYAFDAVRRGNWLTTLGGFIVLLTIVGTCLTYLLAMAPGSYSAPSAEQQVVTELKTLQGLVLGSAMWVVGWLKERR